MAAADGAGLDAGFFKFLGLEGVANKDVAGGAEEADDGVVLADGEGLVESGEAVLFNEVPPGEVAEVIGGRADKAVAAEALGVNGGFVEEGVFWGEMDGDGKTQIFLNGGAGIGVEL